MQIPQSSIWALPPQTNWQSKTLPKNSQKVLHYASLIGHTFDPSFIANIINQDLISIELKWSDILLCISGQITNNIEDIITK